MHEYLVPLNRCHAVGIARVIHETDAVPVDSSVRLPENRSIRCGSLSTRPPGASRFRPRLCSGLTAKTTANTGNGNGRQQPHVDSPKLVSIRCGRRRMLLGARHSVFKTAGSGAPAGCRASAARTATPVANRAIWRHSAVSSESEPRFLIGRQRSVNRKVQGSNPCPGANLAYEERLS